MQVLQALVSGSLGQAMFFAEGAHHLLEAPDAKPRPILPNEMAWFRKARHVSLVDSSGLPVSIEQVRRHLGEEIHLFNALDGLLVGMDRDFSDDLRKRSILRAEHLLTNNPNFAKVVRERFLIPLNTQEWDPRGGLERAVATKADEAAACYRPLAQGIIDRLADDIGAAVVARLGSDVEGFRHRERILHSGLLAELALIESRRDRKALSNIIFRREQFPKLRMSDPSGQILAGVIRRVEERLEQETGHAPALVSTISEIENEADDSQAIADIDPILLAVERAVAIINGRKDKRLKGSAADLPSIQREIDWIGQRLKTGQVSRAEHALLTLLERQSQRSRIEDIVKTLTAVADLARLAREYDWTGRLLAALEHLGASDAAALTVRSQVLRETGRGVEALSVLEEAMRRFPQNEVVPTAYAEALREAGHRDKALRVFEQTMHRFPQDEVAPTAYAEALREAGRRDEALSVLEETMRRFPQTEVPRNAYAEALREVGRRDEAWSVFEETMRRFPQDVVSRNAYAHALAASQRLAEAEAILLPAAKKSQTRNDWIAVHILAMAWLRSGRIAEALGEFERGLRDCTFADVRRYFVTARPLALIAARRSQEAIHELESLAAGQSLSQHEATNIVLFKAHALAEVGQQDAAKRLVSSAEIIDLAAAKQKRLAATLEKRYGLSSGVPASPAEVEKLNGDIISLESELVQPRFWSLPSRKAA
jgi:tetratricopeptide (TPR) repeat protein